VRRVALIVCSLLAVSLAVLLLSFDSIVEGRVHDVFKKLEARIGHPLRFESAETDGLDTVVVHGIEVGPIGAPHISVKHVAVVLDRDALWKLRPVPTLVQIDSPLLRVESGGTPMGLAQALKRLMPPKRPETVASSNGSKPRRQIPAINVHGGRLVDGGKVVDIADGEVTSWRGRIQGSARVATPAIGLCHFAGSPDGVELRCERPYAHPLPGDFKLLVGELEVKRTPALSIRVPKIQLHHGTTDGSLLGSILSGIAIDASIELKADADGKWPIETKLSLPGGGLILGKGRASMNDIELSAEVDGLQIGKAHEAIGGTLAGRYTVRLDREQKRGWIEGEGRLENLTAEHPSLADGPIGPFSMALSGKASAHIKNLSNRSFSLSLEGAKASLGEAQATLGASIEAEGGEFEFKANFELPLIDGSLLVAAVPKGLLPNLEPLQTRGRLGLNAEVEIDSRDYKATKLNIEIPMKKFAITRLNRKIDFDRIRQTFTARFEVPGDEEGEVKTLTRESGPISKRWVSLDEAAPLLPLAVRTQEDGGFYNHGGVSLLHLRGSLIRNLERGRFARGGSTITMQLARNLFLNRRKTLARKFEEIILAWLLEQEFDKDELIAIYINLVEFGPDIYGIQEATRHYFDKEPSELTAPEVAWIVRLLPGPRIFYPMFQKGRLTRGHTNSINRLLRLLVKKGHLAEELSAPIGRDGLWPNGTGGRPKKTPRRTKKTSKAADSAKK